MSEEILNEVEAEEAAPEVEEEALPNQEIGEMPECPEGFEGAFPQGGPQGMHGGRPPMGPPHGMHGGRPPMAPPHGMHGGRPPMGGLEGEDPEMPEFEAAEEAPAEEAEKVEE